MILGTSLKSFCFQKLYPRLNPAAVASPQYLSNIQISKKSELLLTIVVLILSGTNLLFYSVIRDDVYQMLVVKKQFLPEHHVYKLTNFSSAELIYTYVSLWCGFVSLCLGCVMDMFCCVGH